MTTAFGQDQNSEQLLTEIAGTAETPSMGRRVAKGNEKAVAQALRAYDEAAAAWNQAREMGRNPEPDTIRAVFNAARSVLLAYCRPLNQANEGRPIEQFPTPVASFLARQLGYIVAGKLPKTIADLIRPGAPGIGPDEAHDIGIAVLYRKAVAEGLIEDRSPAKSLAIAYGVTERTVSRWAKQMAHLKIADYFPYGEADEVKATVLIQSAVEAGARYQLAGRGAKGRAAFPRPNKRQRSDS